eukprot:1138807-Pelagomonas_calceolata.AAC.9
MPYIQIAVKPSDNSCWKAFRSVRSASCAIHQVSMQGRRLCHAVNQRASQEAAQFTGSRSIYQLHMSQACCAIFQVHMPLRNISSLG